MAATVTEILSSRPLEHDDAGKVARRTFRVFDTVDPITGPDTVELLFGTLGMPVIGEVFPGLPNMFATRPPIIRLVDGTSDLWEVEWIYHEATGPSLPWGTPGSYDFNTRTFRNFHEMWRSRKWLNSNSPFPQLVVPDGGNPSNQNDIGGEHIDNGKEPGSAQRFQQTLEIAEFVEGPIDWSAQRDATGARNSQFFYGGNPGSLVLVDASTRRIKPNVYQRTWMFMFDEFFHMEQRPDRDFITGEPHPRGGLDKWKHTAESVYWIQPIPNLYDFHQLSNVW